MDGEEKDGSGTEWKRRVMRPISALKVRESIVFLFWLDLRMESAGKKKWNLDGRSAGRRRSEEERERRSE